MAMYGIILRGLPTLRNVKRKYHVAYDRSGEGVFVVMKPDGTVFWFEESPDGLHYLDTARDLQTHEGATMVLSTISKNKDSYTHNDYLHAVRARQLQITLGQPSTKDFARIITANTILNCPVTLADINAAEFIFGPEVGSLKGKTTR